MESSAEPAPVAVLDTPARAFSAEASSCASFAMISGRILFKDGSSRDVFFFCTEEGRKAPSPPAVALSEAGVCISSFPDSTLSFTSLDELSNDSSNIRNRFSFLYF